MDYSRPDLADRLAAEYVLGTLHGPARRRFEALLPAHPTLRRATSEWERRLAQLALSTPEVAPSPRVWEGIERRLFEARQASASVPGQAPHQPPGQGQQVPPAVGQAVRGAVRWWERLALWRGVAAFATVAAMSLAMSLAMLLAQPVASKPPIVIVMAAQPGAAGHGIQPAAFVASISGDGRNLVLKPVDETQQVALNKALELWAVPAKGAPRSLGLVSGQGATTVVRASLLSDTAAFAISVEPPGGSPSGAPTGPIVSVGKLQL
jgi:anti-sigma-K factor RskA